LATFHAAGPGLYPWYFRCKPEGAPADLLKAYAVASGALARGSKSG
jgi:hypothetical protein